MWFLVVIGIIWLAFFDGLNTIGEFNVLDKFKQISSKDECRSYSDYTCNQLENSSYNVFFDHPSGNQEYLGVSRSLSGCGNMSHRFANNENISLSDGWGYICCLKTKTSECAEKHR